MIDAIAFKELYKTVYQDLYRFALCMMHHPQDAEDAVSEAVLSAYENIHKLRKEEAFRSWIFQILANVCRRKLKSRERTETELKEDHASATYCEIGKMLRMNPNTVRSRRKRALEKMSWLLKE